MLTDSAYILFDAKAAGVGFDCDLDVVRQFASYVIDFHERYANLHGRAHAFLCVAGSFANPPEKLNERSAQLYAEVGIQLAFLDANNLADAVDHFSSAPPNRQATDWKLVFSRVIILAKDVIAASRAAGRDRLTR